MTVITDMCISIVSAEIIDDIMPVPLYAFKVRGGYTSTDLANKAAETDTRQMDSNHDILVAPMKEWLSMNFKKYCNSNKYQQTELDLIMNPPSRGASSPAGDIESNGDTRQNHSTTTIGNGVLEVGESDINKCSSITRVTVESLAHVVEDLLTIDPIIARLEQTHFCFSYITKANILLESQPSVPRGADDNSIICFKIHGIFKTAILAEQYALSAMNRRASGGDDELNNIYISEIGKWVLLDLRENMTVEQTEIDMNKIMSFINIERVKQDQEFIERVQLCRNQS